MKPSVGIVVPQGFRSDLPTIPAGEQYAWMEEILLRAEKLGFDSAWLYDHFYTFPHVRREPVFEPWTTLTAFAKASHRIRLGTVVTCNSYRSPAMLAKMSSIFDVISGGRMEFGIGAGWYEAEYLAYGYDFPRNATRVRMLDEAVQIIKMMWTEDEASFDGRFYKIAGAINLPKPLQKPRPRMLIGGAGERLTLKVVAKHADRWNTGGDPTAYQQKKEALARHLESVGRAAGEVECTYHGIALFEKSEELASSRLTDFCRMAGIASPAGLAKNNPIGSTASVANFLGRLVDLGVTTLMLYVVDVDREGKLEELRDGVISGL